MSVTKYLIAACSFSDTVQKQLMDRHPDGSASPGGELFKESFGVWVEPEDYRISKVLIAHFEIRWSYPPSSGNFQGVLLFIAREHSQIPTKLLLSVHRFKSLL